MLKKSKSLLLVAGTALFASCNGNSSAPSSQPTTLNSGLTSQNKEQRTQETSSRACTITPAEKVNGADFTGNYNIKIGDNVMNGNASEYGNVLDAGKDIASLEQDGVCGPAALECSIVPAGKVNGADFTGNYNIKIGDTVINGNTSEYGNVFDTAKDIAQLQQDGVCGPAALECSIVPAGKVNGADFTGNYNIKIGDIVINGNASEYGNVLDAGKDVAQLQKDGVCKTAPVQCSVVPAGKVNGADFTGNYNIKIGDIVINGNASGYGNAVDAGKDIGQLKSDGLCE